MLGDLLLGLLLGVGAAWALLLLLARERRIYRRAHSSHVQLSVGAPTLTGRESHVAQQARTAAVSRKRESLPAPPCSVLDGSMAADDLRDALNEAYLRHWGTGQ